MAQGVGVRLGVAELAYLGDAVFELMVRDMLIKSGVPFASLNKQAKKYVSALGQSEMYHRIFDQLSAEEQAVMKRGRNLHSASRSKNAGVVEYRHATGLEALFGQLYAEGQFERLKEVFDLCLVGNVDDLGKGLQPR